MPSGEEDFTKRAKSLVDLQFVDGVAIATPTVEGCVPVSLEHIARISHEQILGTALKTPTIAQSIPTSIENPAIAYDLTNDRFKIDIVALTYGTLPVDMSDEWTRQLGLVDISRVLGAALSHSNPVIVRLTSGSAFIDPRDMTDRAARLVGQVYGSLDVLQQRATTKELLVQILHAGVEKDPTAIRALTSTDVVTVVQATAANLKAEIPQLREADYTYLSFSKTATGDIRDPDADKKVKVAAAFFYCAEDIIVELRWKTSGDVVLALPTRGAIGFEMKIDDCPLGDTDEVLELYLSDTGTAKGWIMYKDVD